MKILRKKPIERSLLDSYETENSLKKTLSWFDLTCFGTGLVIGAGIFTLTGRAAATHSGPAVVVSFVIAAVVCALAALCYAEFASTVPVSGSAYSFAYASLDEMIAWIIAWDLMLELILGTGIVAQGWSQYADLFLQAVGIEIPRALAPHTADNPSNFNVLAFAIVVILTAIVAWGIKETMRVNFIFVAIKLFVVLFVIVAGFFYINPANYQPFVPPAESAEQSTGAHQPLIQALFGFEPVMYGVGGIVSGAALVFFAYLGFEVVASAAEEAKRPRRDIPIGILLSLLVCTVLYAAVAVVITGMVKYDEISPQAALATAFTHVGHSGFATLIAAGAVAGLTTVVMTLIVGATRLLFAMSRDRLLPKRLSKVNEITRTPVVLTAIVGGVIALIAGFVTVDLGEMINIGTLAAFTIVSISVPILRRRRPDLPRAFKVPFSPVLPIVSALCSVYLMLNLSIETWLRFIVWMLLGFAIYFAYSYRNAELNRDVESIDDVFGAATPSHR